MSKQKRSLATVLTLLALLCGSTAALAADRIAVGDELSPFVLGSSEGSEYSSASLEGDKNLLLVFFRGTW